MAKKQKINHLGADYSMRSLLSLIDAISGHLKKMIIILLVLLVISQTLLQSDAIRHWLTSADRWEGTLMN